MGQFQRDWNQLEHRQHHHCVEHQRARGHYPGHAVVGDHEHQHQSQPHQAGQKAVTQRLGTQVSVNVALLDHLERHLQAARLQLNGQRASLFSGEVTADLCAPVADPGPRHWRDDFLVVHVHCDALCLNSRDSAGQVREDVGSASVKLQVDHPADTYWVGRCLRAFQVVAC